ncbi:FUSC family protein [Solirubrobacter ginsenosidimutans]|uniref:FUSC family protein n=2 Tax=Solirubrobacter ginsenosidimutans TaxID=490573 RepID=A0A9X3MP02_9ACTN|nr:FUSC family protein [Solirubrobacter ginsenosidimutans]
MVAVLGAYGSALLLAHMTHQHAQLMVLAVVLTLTLERTQRTADRAHRVRTLVLLPLIAVAASQVGPLLVHHPNAGDALFVIAIAGSIWVRRFGSAAARAGTLVALPFIALLTTPIVAAPGSDDPTLWAAVVAVIAFTWVTALHLATGSFGAADEAGAQPRPSAARRLPASTRMAVQMGLSLGIAFAAGRALFPAHWSWVVLTAFIVASGNRGRADVLHKSGLRIAGALAGTIAATLLAGRIAPGEPITVVAIFVVLAAATWLRPLSYAFWAAGITAVLALLNGYFGERGDELLGQRLLGILVGAAIAVAAAWLVLPVRTTDVLRRRIADALAALSDVIAGRETGSAAHRFAGTVEALEQIARPLRLQRRLRAGAHRADAIDAVAACAAPVATLATAPAERLTRHDTRRHLGQLARDVGAIRRHIGGKAPAPPADRVAIPSGDDAVSEALAELDAALTRLATVPLGPRGYFQK